MNRPALSVLGLLLFLSCPLCAQCETKVIAEGTLAGDEFGSKIVMSGHTAFIGAYEHDSLLLDGGIVHVYERRDNAWVRTQALAPVDAMPGDWFGFGMGLDRDRALVSSHAWNSETGKATVFERIDGVWEQDAVLVASEGGPGDWVGIRCDLQGSRAILGAPNDDDQGVNAGAAYLFEKIAGEWVETAKLKASNGKPGSMFGFDVSIHGETALVGAWRHRRAGMDTGAAYVFERKDGQWVETADLRATGLRSGDEYGIGVSLSGSRVLIGARGDNQAGRTDSGCAYIFDKLDGQWTQSAKILASLASSFDEFGNNVILDGDRALIGAYQANELRGRAYLYELHAGQWFETRTLDAADQQRGDLFGYDVALSGDHLAIGAFLSDSAGDRSGAAYFNYATEVGLESSTYGIAPGATLTLSSCGGTPGNPVLPVLTAVQGQSSFVPLTPLQSFDELGSWAWSSSVPEAWSGFEVQVRLYALGKHGVVASNAVNLKLY